MCYLFDGVDDDDCTSYDKPVANCFCRFHAEEVILNNPKLKEKYRSQEQNELKTANIPIPVARKRPGVNKTDKRKNEHSPHRASFNRQGSIRKRKFGAADGSPPKRQSVNDAVNFPVQGKASRAMSNPKLKTDTFES